MSRTPAGALVAQQSVPGLLVYRKRHRAEDAKRRVRVRPDEPMLRLNTVYP